MDKLINVDVIATLRDIMQTNTAFYQTDFNYDAELIKQAAKGNDLSEMNLLWFSRQSGTFCNTEHNVFLQDTSAHNSWLFHAEQSSDRILAYAVHIGSVDQSGAVVGDIYELDYKQHASFVNAHSVPYSDVTVIFENGDTERMTKETFNQRLNDGAIAKIRDMRYEPIDHTAFSYMLDTVREQCVKSCVEATPYTHVQRQSNGRITHEAARIKAGLDKLSEPNSPNGKSFIVEVSPYFLELARNDDMQKLLKALSYNDVTVSALKERTGMYAVVSADEILSERTPLSEKPLYKHDAPYAHEHGEIDQYRDSHKLNVACAKAIDKYARENFDGMRLKADVAKQIIDEYGVDRVTYVLANTVQYKDNDGRFSRSNKEWAKRIEIHETDNSRRANFVADFHPAVMDGIVRLVRGEIDNRKPSIIEQLNAGKESAKSADMPEKQQGQKKDKSI